MFRRNIFSFCSAVAANAVPPPPKSGRKITFASADAAAAAAENAAREASKAPLRRTSLYEFHKENKAKLVAYAGWEMPLQYEGMTKEHIHSREHVSLFDVSHMCQVTFLGKDRERFLEWVTPGDIRALKVNRGRLTLLMLPNGGIKDDCMVFKGEDALNAVLNAGTAPSDIEYLQDRLDEFGGDVHMTIRDDLSLIALQGPKAAEVLSKWVPGLEEFPFLATQAADIEGTHVQVTRCGYTGEDGFELSVKNDHATKLARILTADGIVKAAGLGARDTLRLESGLCLYGHEMSENTDPISADLGWTITKRRREEANFIGAEAVLSKLKNKDDLVPRVRVGIVSPKGPCPRDNTSIHIHGDTINTNPIGVITSGAPSPTIQKNVAQGFLEREYAKPGTIVDLMVRNKRIPGEVVKLPFVPQNYFRMKKAAATPAAATPSAATPPAADAPNGNAAAAGAEAATTAKAEAPPTA